MRWGAMQFSVLMLHLGRRLQITNYKLLSKQNKILFRLLGLVQPCQSIYITLKRGLETGEQMTVI